MAAPSLDAAAAAAASDAESYSSTDESSDSDDTNDGMRIAAHPRASASDFESSVLQVANIMDCPIVSLFILLRSCRICSKMQSA